jgi:hypothetical protein
MTVFAIYPVMQNALTILWWWFFDWWLFGRWIFNRWLGLVFVWWWFGWLFLVHIDCKHCVVRFAADSSDGEHIHRFSLPVSQLILFSGSPATSTGQNLVFHIAPSLGGQSIGFKELRITGELDNCVDLRNGFGAILFCGVTKHLSLGPIANDQIRLFGLDLRGLFENSASLRKLLDPTKE